MKAVLRPFAGLLLTTTVALGAGCSEEPIELTVDVRTDYVPVADFDVVETEVAGSPFEATATAGADAVTTAVRVSDDFFEGARVAEIADLAPGRMFVRTRLKLRGAIIATQIVDLQIAESYALTVVMTRNCRSITCPEAGDPEGFTACLDGECVDPRCTPSTPEHCGAVCSADSDCPSGPGCASARCVRGVCLCEAPHGLVDGGSPDGGTSECVVGETEEEMQPCGECGEGTQTRTRACEMGTEFGVWGAWGAWGTCDTPATCSPGATESDMRACGNCNSGRETRTRSCDAATCMWGAWSAFGACTGASGCAPGATMGCANGDSCGHRVCQGDCTWGGCEARVQCLRIRPGTSGPEGNNWRCCGSSRWQFCLPSCTWSTDCVSCSGCGC